MNIDYDQQVLESVSVRRSRLLKSFLFGPERTRRLVSDIIKGLVISAVIAALICAGCVGYSLVVDLFAQQKERTQQTASPTPWQTPTLTVATAEHVESRERIT